MVRCPDSTRTVEWSLLVLMMSPSQAPKNAIYTTTAISTERVIDSVSCDHECAANQGNSDFGCMRWQTVSEPCAAEYERQANRHQQWHTDPLMNAVSLDQRNHSD